MITYLVYEGGEVGWVGVDVFRKKIKGENLFFPHVFLGLLRRSRMDVMGTIIEEGCPHCNQAVSRIKKIKKIK